MSARVGTAPSGHDRTTISLASRLWGYGSVFGKAIRDSRRAFLVEVSFVGGFLFIVLAGFANAYVTQEARDEIARVAAGLGPIGGGLVGPIVKVGTMGGYVTYRYGVVFGIVAALWSILSLTGTLAGEARRGSLDIVLAMPLSRRRIATEKVAAHLTLLAIMVSAVALAAWAAGTWFAKLPGDEIPPEAAAGFALWIGFIAVWFGGLAFAMAQFVGRGPGAWIAGFMLVGGPLLINYRSLVPAFGVFDQLTPWWWTWDQAAALAGRHNWLSLIPVAIAATVFIVIGVEAFARPDIGGSLSTPIRKPRLPSPAVGLGGPLGRSLAERAPLGLAWGISIGAFGLLMAGGAHTIADRLSASPDLTVLFESAFPNLDLSTTGGFLQLLIKLLYIVAGFAAATLVSGWASDETSGRLDMVLATPLTRAGWTLRSGSGVLAAIALMTAIIALGVGAGAAMARSDVFTPMLGTVVLGLFAAAVAGIGFAVGGLGRVSIAGEVVVVVVVATYLVDLMVPALNLPSDARQLALTAHLGQPMVGVWDWPGVVVSVVFAVGGLAVGAWGIARRDIGR